MILCKSVCINSNRRYLFGEIAVKELTRNLDDLARVAMRINSAK